MHADQVALNQHTRTPTHAPSAVRSQSNVLRISSSLAVCILTTFSGSKKQVYAREPETLTTTICINDILAIRIETITENNKDELPPLSETQENPVERKHLSS